jgi:type I restriction enzyme S subunit
MSATNGHILGDVASFVRGITFTPEDVKQPFEKGTAVCMRTKNVQVDLDEQDLISVPKEFVRRKEQYLTEGDLLVSSANSWNLVGKCCWVPRLDYEATAGGFISILRADREKVDPRYLYHWFASPRTQHEVRLCGRQTTNISNLNYERCLSLGFPLPTLEEQKRIATILDKADAIRRKRQQSFKELDHLVDASFVDIFGSASTASDRFDVLPLGNVAERIVVGHVGPTSHGYAADGIPFLRTQNVRPLHINEADIKYITRKFDAQLNKSRIQAGNVLISRVGANRGMAAVVPPHLDGANCANIIVIGTGGRLNPEYLAYTVNSAYGQRALLGVSVGSAQGVINVGAVKDWPVAVPDNRLQEAFACVVRKVESLRCNATKHATEADRLFNSLLQRAFKGNGS